MSGANSFGIFRQNAEVSVVVVIVVVVVVVPVAAATTRTTKSIHNTCTVNGASSYKESYHSRSNRMVYVSISLNSTRSTILIGSNINSSICGNGSNSNRNCT